MVGLIRAFAVGIGTGLLAAVLWVLGALFVPPFLEMLIVQFQNRAGGVGAGAVAVSVSSGSILLAALVGFALGAGWTILRARRPRARSE